MKPRRARVVALLMAAVMAISFAVPVSAATTNLPFSWTLKIKYRLDGRDMHSNTGTFCQWFHSTSVDSHETDKAVYITLYRIDNSIDEKVGITVRYPADGKQYVYCWRGFSTSYDYWFEYAKKQDELYISAAGNVQDH